MVVLLLWFATPRVGPLRPWWAIFGVRRSIPRGCTTRKGKQRPTRWGLVSARQPAKSPYLAETRRVSAAGIGLVAAWQYCILVQLWSRASAVWIWTRSSSRWSDCSIRRLRANLS